MSRLSQANRLNMQAFAQEGEPLIASTPLQNMERLVNETQGIEPDALAQWQASGELRPHAGHDDDVWLHLQASATVPLTCQRCMAPVATFLEVDQWYRFVADETVAMAEDDQAEEDLLVMEPQFDLLALVEDELLMALPLVPMHAQCPVTPVMQAGNASDQVELIEKPNPFAVLSQLKTKK